MLDLLEWQTNLQNLLLPVFIPINVLHGKTYMTNSQIFGIRNIIHPYIKIKRDHF